MARIFKRRDEMRRPAGKQKKQHLMMEKDKAKSQKAKKIKQDSSSGSRRSTIITNMIPAASFECDQSLPLLPSSLPPCWCRGKGALLLCSGRFLSRPPKHKAPPVVVHIHPRVAVNHRQPGETEREQKSREGEDRRGGMKIHTYLLV